MICPYCGEIAKLTDSSIIYGKSYGRVYLCSNWPKCDSYVGVHKSTNKPLGRMANYQLRQLKKEAHSLFDLLWKSGGMNRKVAYTYLQDIMELSEDEAHIGKFDEDQCRKLISILRNEF